MKRLTLIIIGVLLCTPLYSDMNTYIAGVPVSGGCSSACDPESNEVGNRVNNSGSGGAGNIGPGASMAYLATPDCAGYLTTANIYSVLAVCPGPVKILVYEDDGDNAPGGGDSLVSKTGSISGGEDTTWYGGAILDCSLVDTEKNYWVVIAVDDDSANGWRYEYSNTGGTAYTATDGDYYDTEPATLETGSWSSVGRHICVYVTLD